MALFTLRKMAAGGMHDHIGGGFHRYSVDRYWHVPHFEKMLYDQAQLATAYLDAFQITQDRHYAEVAHDILDYVAHDKALLDAWRSTHPQALEKFHEQLIEIDPTALPAGPADLLIRTGRGRCRSDFMLWEVAYARLHNCENPWADFTVKDFCGALDFRARAVRLP